MSSSPERFGIFVVMHGGGIGLSVNAPEPLENWRAAIIKQEFDEQRIKHRSFAALQYMYIPVKEDSIA